MLEKQHKTKENKRMERRVFTLRVTLHKFPSFPSVFVHDSVNMLTKSDFIWKENYIISRDKYAKFIFLHGDYNKPASVFSNIFSASDSG